MYKFYVIKCKDKFIGIDEGGYPFLTDEPDNICTHFYSVFRAKEILDDIDHFKFWKDINVSRSDCKIMGVSFNYTEIEI